MRPFTVWLFGRPCSGKTTLGKALLRHYSRKWQIDYLDGDDLRKRFPWTGFSKKDRRKHAKNVRDICIENNKKGISNIVSLITPYEIDRKLVKKEIENSVLIYCMATGMVCMRRDVKGMYAAAIRGEIRNFTGVTGEFQYSESHDFSIDTEVLTVKESVSQAKAFINGKLEGI